jgi:hypothetical protein
MSIASRPAPQAQYPALLCAQIREVMSKRWKIMGLEQRARYQDNVHEVQGWQLEVNEGCM